MRQQSMPGFGYQKSNKRVRVHYEIKLKTKKNLHFQKLISLKKYISK